jgi:iron(III) transport system permease protein
MQMTNESGASYWVVLSKARFNATLLLVVFFTAIIIALLLLIGWVSFQVSIFDLDTPFTLKHYADLYLDSATYVAALNTFIFSLIATGVAMAIGVPIAWLVTRTDLPGKGILFTGMTLGVLMPGFFTAMGWLWMFHPRIGLANQIFMQVFGTDSGFFNVVSVPGMGLVQGLNLAAVVFVLTAASLRVQNASLDEAAQMCGGGVFYTLKRITIPLAFPGILAAGLFVFTIAIGAFDVPAIIGMSNRITMFSTYLYDQTHPQGELPHYGTPAAFSSFMLIVAVLLSVWYSRLLVNARKYQVVTGKNYKLKHLKLGKYSIGAWLLLGFYLVMVQLMPILLLVWAAITPFMKVPSAAALATVSLANFKALPWDLVGRGFCNTLVLALVAPVLALVVSLAFSWIAVRSKSRFGAAFDFVAFLPHAIPSIVFGLGILLFSLFASQGSMNTYGSLFQLLLAYVIVQLSFGTRITNGALVSINDELVEAAYTSGASGYTILRKVILPLLKPALAYGWLWLALLTMRELTLATMLFSSSNVTLSVVVWSQWSSGQTGAAAAISVLMLTALLPLILLFWWMGGEEQKQ